MGKFTSVVRKRFPLNGRLFKSLTIIYLVWLYVNFTLIDNYGHNSFGTASLVVFISSFLSIYVPIFISAVYENVYNVLLLGPKQRQKYLSKMDERQLQSRRQIFEKSYLILAALVLLVSFLSNGHYINNLSLNGEYCLWLNIMIFVFGLPSLVAVWDKNPTTH